MIREFRCDKCDETFIGDTDDDRVHIQREDGVECGGRAIQGHYTESFTFGSPEGVKAIIDALPDGKFNLSLSYNDMRELVKALSWSAGCEYMEPGEDPNGNSGIEWSLSFLSSIAQNVGVEWI